MSKIEDFGVHANQYYPLDVSFFKSSLDSHMLDMLWNKCAASQEVQRHLTCSETHLNIDSLPMLGCSGGACTC
jgi:hypothetical protein